MLSKKLIHVFHVNKLSSIRVYMALDNTYDALQELIAEQTDIRPHSQVLLVGEKLLQQIVEATTPGRGYPKFTETSPVYLFRYVCNIELKMEM